MFISSIFCSLDTVSHREPFEQGLVGVICVNGSTEDTYSSMFSSGQGSRKAFQEPGSFKTSKPEMASNSKEQERAIIKTGFRFFLTSKKAQRQQ